MASMSRPVTLIIKATGNGKTSPRQGTHYLADEPFQVGIAEGQLKYWIIDGKIVKKQLLQFQPTENNKNFSVEAVFGEQQPVTPKFSDDLSKLIGKDLEAIKGVTAQK